MLSQDSLLIRRDEVRDLAPTPERIIRRCCLWLCTARYQPDDVSEAICDAMAAKPKATGTPDETVVDIASRRH